jgi:hypothetical protein
VSPVTREHEIPTGFFLTPRPCTDIICHIGGVWCLETFHTGQNVTRMSTTIDVQRDVVATGAALQRTYVCKQVRTAS